MTMVVNMSTGMLDKKGAEAMMRVEMMIAAAATATADAMATVTEPGS